MEATKLKHRQKSLLCAPSCQTPGILTKIWWSDWCGHTPLATKHSFFFFKYNFLYRIYLLDAMMYKRHISSPGANQVFFRTC